MKDILKQLWPSSNDLWRLFYFVLFVGLTVYWFGWRLLLCFHIFGSFLVMGFDERFKQKIAAPSGPPSEKRHPEQAI